MAIYGRDAVLTGQTVSLYSVVTDDRGNLVNTDVLPNVYLYPPSISDEILEEEILTGIYASAIGPLVPVAVGLGFYKLDYLVPTGSEEGPWIDYWIGTIDGVTADVTLSFKVAIGGNIVSQTLSGNQLVVVELDSSIRTIPDIVTLKYKSLKEDMFLSFLTELSPFYASPDLVRLEVGTWIDYIPDTTLALMLHWSSQEADFIQKPTYCNSKDLEYARAKFVTFDTALRALLLPGGASSSGFGVPDGTSKVLGDLSIHRKNVGNTVAVTSSGIDVDTLNYIRSQRAEWWRVVNAGACIVPGQGLGMESGVKGLNDPNRRNAGRQWLDPSHNNYQQPSTNSKTSKNKYTLGKFAFSGRKK